MEAAETTGYWQDLHDAWPAGVQKEPPFQLSYPVRLPSGRILVLPIRPLPDGRHAVASLIANQASFAVVEALGAAMGDITRDFSPDIVVGLPTLGLTFAPLVANAIGQSRFAPLGYSRKFWYDETLSEPVVSITSPAAAKRLYLDPNLVTLVQRRRVCLVDDAISSGSSILAAARLLARVDVEIACVVVAMKQTRRWEAALAASQPSLPARVLAVFGCPLFERGPTGWHPLPQTQPALP